MKTICYYTIARFVPDLIRNEPRNIGLILLNEDQNFFQAKFLNTGHAKVNSLLSFESDKEIIIQYSKYFKHNAISSKQQLLDTIGNNHASKIQFSEVRAVVTEDIESEVDNLYNTFVNEKIAVAAIRSRRLKTIVQNELKELKLIGSRKIQTNARVSAAKSNLEHQVDFLYTKNNHMYVIDAVDLTTNDKRDTYKTAFKFEDLRNGRKKYVDTISLVKKPKNENVKEFLEVLQATSTVYDFANGQKALFIDKMKKIIK